MHLDTAWSLGLSLLGSSCVAECVGVEGVARMVTRCVRGKTIVWFTVFALCASLFLGLIPVLADAPMALVSPNNPFIKTNPKADPDTFPVGNAVTVDPANTLVYAVTMKETRGDIVYNYNDGMYWSFVKDQAANTFKSLIVANVSGDWRVWAWDGQYTKTLAVLDQNTHAITFTMEIAPDGKTVIFKEDGKNDVSVSFDASLYSPDPQQRRVAARAAVRPGGMVEIDSLTVQQVAGTAVTPVPQASPTPAQTAACSPLAPNSPFAFAGFQSQWQQGEGIAANFWGPSATVGLQEPYAEAPGGQRLVQYFDKGRMELTNPSAGTVTNGLLANELITGQVQTGNAAFQSKAAATIPIAGDPDNAGPTYAALGTTAAAIMSATPAQTGNGVTMTVAANGTVTPGTPQPGSGPMALTIYDSVTQHNVPQAFAQYRDTVGLLTVGLAKSEPFLTTVKVGGVQKQVMVQVFERRVLTYTADNPPAFQVEMGNIGQHYYKWRYCSGS